MHISVGHEGHYDADIGALAMQSWQPAHDSQHRDVEEHLTRGIRAGCFLLSHPLHIGSKHPWPACPRDMSGRALLFSPSQPAWKASNSDLELDRALCTSARQNKQGRICPEITISLFHYAHRWEVKSQIWFSGRFGEGRENAGCGYRCHWIAGNSRVSLNIAVGHAHTMLF